jgi:exosortase
MSNAPLPRTALVPLAAGVAACGWAFYPTLAFMYEKWVGDPQYSHGFLVPAFSGYLLWTRRPTVGTPLPLLAAGLLLPVLLLRWLAGGLMFHQLDCLAFILSLAVLTVGVGGWAFLRTCAPAIGFLIFMVPLPFELERNVGGPLKEVATAGSTYLLQTLGLPAVAEGHVILIDEVRLGVVDACSGLKMLMTFSAFAAGAVLTLGRTRFENLLVVLGVVPIAVLTNVLRITATGVAHTLTANKDTLHFLHDLHGWLMMPTGLALLGVQLWCLGRLVERPAEPATAYAPLRPSFA